ncbi:hypothetical protein [Spiroplasma sp. DGKH1]|uniref:hypothetical protein n=1 Tax=Spiroplasma sp. DGKH1 TaxID=3050074 RepID=UPI0034C5EB96
MNKKYILFGLLISLLSLIAIITSSVAISKINNSKISDYKSYLERDGEVVFCNSTIWAYYSDSHMTLSCRNSPQSGDVRWDGKYPEGYFDV